MTEVWLPNSWPSFGAVRGLVTGLDGSPLTVACSSPFGPRDPISTGAGTTSPFHCGADFPYEEKAPLLNPTPWKAIVTAEGAALNGYGNVVFATIVEGSCAGQQLVWAHMTPGLHAGRFQIVEPGGVVGQLGTTGASTGPHVHFGVLKASVPLMTDINMWIDPAFWDDPIPWLASI